MISIKNLSHKYDTKEDSARPPALNALNLNIKQGAFCVAIGPNGSGKSTLFQILSGMFRPSEGTAEINGFTCSTAEARQSIGIVFQNPALDKILTVRENLAFFGNLHGLTGRSLANRIDAVTAWTHIADRLDTPAGQLSGGQQRQAELAKCLIPAPPVLLLDEPTTGLDPVGRQAFQDTITSLQKQSGLTILMTTHVFSEAEHADQVAILDKGCLIAEGTPRSLCETLGTEVITIQCKSTDSAAPQTLASALHTDGFASACATSLDVRIDDLNRGDAIPTITQIMEHHGPNIASIAIKQPTLDDVFISLTSGNAS